MKLVIFILIVLLFKITVEENLKYCEPSLCRLGRPHIACPGNAINKCPNDAVEIAINDDMQRLILEKHNNYRNMLAEGNLTRFESAKNMPFMQWDNELQETARANVLRCVFEHDLCHNTKQFKWSGQNLAFSRGYKTDLDHLNKSIDSWWNENRDCTMDEIYKVGHSKKMVGHFTAMSQDRSDRVGCAAIRFNSTSRILGCNYGFTNYLDSYVYLVGTPTSGCKKGRHATYKNLCHETEIVNSNPW